MDILDSPIAAVLKKISDIVYEHATDDLVTDWFECEKMDDDCVMKGIIARDIIYRVNLLVPGTFADITLQNATAVNCTQCNVNAMINGVCKVCEFDEKFDATMVVQRVYRPSKRFVKILKSLAKKGDVELTTEEVEAIDLVYHDVVNVQCGVDNGSGSLLNIYFVILKLTYNLLPLEKHIAIRKCINLPKSKTLVNYDLKWKKICNQIGCLTYGPTDPIRFTIVSIRGKEIMIT